VSTEVERYAFQSVGKPAVGAKVMSGCMNFGGPGLYVQRWTVAERPLGHARVPLRNRCVLQPSGTVLQNGSVVGVQLKDWRKLMWVVSG
jgi:hypothetical protein